MTRSNKTPYAPKTLLLIVALSLLVGGCAAPPSSVGLQQRVNELLQMQEKQGQQLAQLQEQLAKLTTKPLDSAPTLSEPVDVTEQAIPATPADPLPLPIVPSAAEVAEISEAAGLYLEAFGAIATGQMAAAEKDFGTFITRFPDHKYAGNANYWLAEALLSQQKAKRAETVLLDIIDNPNYQNKAAAAMARLVIYYRENNAQNNASAMTQMLNDQYPESPELKRLMRSTEPR